MLKIPLIAMTLFLQLLLSGQVTQASELFPTEQERARALFEHVTQVIMNDGTFAPYAQHVASLQVKKPRRRVNYVRDCGIAWAGDCPARTRVITTERRYLAKGKDVQGLEFTCEVMILTQQGFGGTHEVLHEVHCE